MNDHDDRPRPSPARFAAQPTPVATEPSAASEFFGGLLLWLFLPVPDRGRHTRNGPASSSRAPKRAATRVRKRSEPPTTTLAALVRYGNETGMLEGVYRLPTHVIAAIFSRATVRTMMTLEPGRYICLAVEEGCPGEVVATLTRGRSNEAPVRVIVKTSAGWTTLGARLLYERPAGEKLRTLV